jgi:tagaturonate epimerase
MNQQPQPLALKKSFGFGDRLGLATPGHLASARKFDFAPIFAQQSIREMTRTQRTPEDVMRAATDALNGAQFSGAWGADADHLKTPEDVQATAAAGFTFFTIDPSSFVANSADRLEFSELKKLATQIEREELFHSDDYLGKAFDLDGHSLSFTEETLWRAAVKYGRAVAHSANMAAEIRKHRADADIEISVDETDFATTPQEHLFVGMELQRRRVNVTSLAPRFVGEFEKGIDYKGDLVEFERQLRLHLAIAKRCGPYKISIHSGSDKFTVYPIIGRVCGDLLHVKTAGTSYLEALRVVSRVAPAFFQEIIAYAHRRFLADRVSYHISTTPEEVDVLRGTSATDLERVYLDERAGRQLLHVTFGSVLTVGKCASGQLFRPTMLQLLEKHSDLHAHLLEKHFDLHLGLLSSV